MYYFNLLILFSFFFIFTVELLVKLGGIPYCRTNLPQCILSFDCSNPIFGQSCHPKDKTRTPGGSSGGEAALISFGGSILGIGKYNLTKKLNKAANFEPF